MLTFVDDGVECELVREREKVEGLPGAEYGQGGGFAQMVHDGRAVVEEVIAQRAVRVLGREAQSIILLYTETTRRSQVQLQQNNEKWNVYKR